MTDSPASLLPSPAWARVRILLNLGQIEDATAAATDAAGRTIWCDEHIRSFGPAIHSLLDIPVGWCYLDPVIDLAVVNPAVIEEFGMSVCLFQFVRATRRMEAPGFRWFDVTNWRLLDAMDTNEFEARESDL